MTQALFESVLLALAGAVAGLAVAAAAARLLLALAINVIPVSVRQSRGFKVSIWLTFGILCSVTAWLTKLGALRPPC